MERPIVKAWRWVSLFQKWISWHFVFMKGVRDGAWGGGHKISFHNPEWWPERPIFKFQNSNNIMGLKNETHMNE